MDKYSTPLLYLRHVSHLRIPMHVSSGWGSRGHMAIFKTMFGGCSVDFAAEVMYQSIGNQPSQASSFRKQIGEWVEIRCIGFVFCNL